MSDIAITFAILLAVVLAFVSNRIPVGLVAIGASLALYFTGVLDLTDALAGFGDPAVIFIATLFVVSEGLDATGVTTWAGQILIARVGESRTRLIVLMMLLVAGLTALISVNGAVAALLPVIVVIAVRLGRSPSQLLMPLVFGAHAGSMLALTGTPVNVIVNEAAAAAGGREFGFFEFGLVGIPLVVGSIAIVLFVGERLLPTRTARGLPTDFSRHARTLVEQYRLDDEALTLMSRTSGLAEVVVPPRSSFIGDTVFPGMVTDSGDLVVVAVQRKGEDKGPGEVVLAVGDVLLLQGSWTALDENLADPNLLVVDTPERVRRQVVPLGLGAKEAIVVLAAMVVHARDRDRPVGRRRPARRGGDGPAPGRLGRRCLPRHQLDDGRAGGRDDPALDRDDRDRCRGPRRGHARRRRAQRRARTPCSPACSSSRR